MKPIPILSEPDQKRDVEAGLGALATSRGNLPLKAVEVRTRIDGLLARTVVRQTFTNGHAEPLEATYIFPLPDRAAVSRFRLKVAYRVVEGEIQERAQARQNYEKALQSGHRAAIAEEERPNVFTMRVGNLPPGQSATVELTLTGSLPTDAGEATFRFPLVVAPRYIPGNPLPGDSVGVGTAADTDAVPDASRITPPVLLPGFPNPVHLELSVEVHPGGLHARDFRSSLHTLAEDSDPKALRFRLQPGERMDRDFLLRFRFDDSVVRTALQFQPDEDDASAGTFALTVVPPRDSANVQKPRDVVFVLDRSGSMGGWKMVAARRALGRMIDTLTRSDRFAVLAFDDRVDPFPASGMTEASDRQRFQALEFLTQIEARGGTELAAPLGRGCKLLSDATRDRVLVLLTDGQVGNEDQILRQLASQLKGIRIFTLGIDQAVNDAFLRRMAGLGGGYMDLVESEERLDEVMDKVHRRIASPVLTALTVEASGLKFEPDTLVPDRLPDLFPGATLTILGRYKGSTNGHSQGLCLLGKDDAGQPWTETVQATRGEVLAPVWARGYVRQLEDRYVTHAGETDKLAAQIVATSLKFRVLCRFTAFVAVDVTEVVNEGGQVKRITQPVDPAAGWDMLREKTGAPRGMSGMALGALSLPAACAPAFLHEDFEESDDSGPLAACPPPPSSMPPVHASKKAGRMGIPRTTGKAGSLELTAYRQRVAEMLEQFEKETDVMRKFHLLGVKLDELLDDLRSVGASDTERELLEDLLKALRAFLLKKSAAEQEITQMGERCRQDLAAFVAGSKPSRKWAFWK